jgi:hypothetical protein
VHDLKPVDDVLIHEEEGEAFLLHVASGRYFSLNKTGLVVWQALAAGADPGAAVGQRWPNVAGDVRERDIKALLVKLEGAGLVRRADAPG